MLPSSVCRRWQPDQAANAAQDARSYTTPAGTIHETHSGEGAVLLAIYREPNVFQHSTGFLGKLSNRATVSLCVQLLHLSPRVAQPEAAFRFPELPNDPPRWW